MILTNEQIKEIINTYAKETNVDIEKYSLYNTVNWYSWWWRQTLVWERPVTQYTYEEGKEEIIGYVKHKIYEQDWDERYGYKGNYDGCRKFCKHCKYSTHVYKDKFCSGAGNVFCVKISDKYNLPTEVSDNDNICRSYESIFNNDEFNFDEYYDWLCKEWYVNNKGETTINDKTRAITINKIKILIPYVRFKDMDFIEDGKILCKSYHGGKWSKSKGYFISGKNEIPISELIA